MNAVYKQTHNSGCHFIQMITMLFVYDYCSTVILNSIASIEIFILNILLEFTLKIFNEYRERGPTYDLLQLNASYLVQ